MGDKPATSILATVKGQLREANVKSVQSNVKGLMKKHADAMQVVDGIEAEIASEIESLGQNMSPEEVSTFLRGE